MATIDQLVPFVRLSDDSEDSVVNIRSVSLEGAWQVPLSLLRLEVHEIIRLALTVRSPPTPSHDYATTANNTTTTGSAPRPVDHSPHLTDHDQPAVCITLDQPPTVSEAETLQDYRALMALGSVFALIKYWVFMRMLWRHDGESDRVVISVMAHSENMKQPTPLRNAKNRKRWTIVRHGLNLMEVLLNNRSLLLEVMSNRHLSFTNLICLRSDYLTPINLQRLMENTQHLANQAQSIRGNALSLATLSALCQQGGNEFTSEPPPRLVSSSSPASASSHDSERQTNHSGDGSIIGDPSRSARERYDTSDVESRKKRKRQRSSSRKRKLSGTRSTSSSDSNAEDCIDDRDNKDADSVVDSDSRQRRSQLVERRSEERVRTYSSEEHVGTFPSLPPVQVHSLDRLQAALRRMASVPLLEYFYQLLEAYPQNLSVAAPLYFESADLHLRMISHRLQEQCSALTPMYDPSFLLRYSNRLRFLPALSMEAGGQLGVHGETRPPAPTNVWVFGRGDVDGVACHYQQLLDEMRESKRSRQPPLIPAELLLQHGVHLVLVFQREGETIAQLSGDDLQPLHCLHDVCTGATLSASGAFCSQKHLIEMLQRRSATSDGSDATYLSSEMEQHIVALPANVFKSSPLTEPVALTKPSIQGLQRVGREMDDSGYNADLMSTDQLLYLLDQSLDDLTHRRVTPPLLLLPLLQQLCHHPGLSNASHQAILLALLTKAIALHSVTMDATPCAACSPDLGCNVAERQGSELPLGMVAQKTTPVAFFRKSDPSNHTRLLYVRTPYACRPHQKTFHDDFHHAVLNREEPCTYQVTMPPHMAETITARAPCCAPSTLADDVVDDHVQLSTRIVSQAPLPPHVIRAAPVVSVNNLVLTSAAASSSLQSKLSTFLPVDLVNGGVLDACQAALHSPLYHLFVASELATASRQVYSVIIPVSKRTDDMAWYSHMVNHRSIPVSAEWVTLASVRDVGKQSNVEELYVHCTELASLVQAADVVEEPNQCLLSPFVSTMNGELDQASTQKLIECMVENGLRADSLFLDIGCCYCKVLVHVAYATGINVYGVEALRERTERGKRCVQRWRVTHPELEHRTGGIEIFAGDIIYNIHLLFPATHVLLLDAGFMTSARNVLKHLWGHLADAKLQMVFTCTKLDGLNDAMVPVAQLQVNLAQQEVHLYAYRVNHNPSPARVEVFVSSVHGVGLRVSRGFEAGETVLEIQGLKCPTYAKDDRWPWMVRLTDGWLHVENLARFVNWNYAKARVNVSMKVSADGLLLLQTTRLIRSGDELLSSPTCWAFTAAGEPTGEMASE